MLKVLVQHVHHHAQHVGKIATNEMASPPATSYSKSQTTIVVKCSLTTATALRRSGAAAPGDLRVDHATHEGLLDQVDERLLRPLRFREGVVIAGESIL